jgi:protease IV
MTDGDLLFDRRRLRRSLSRWRLIAGLAAIAAIAVGAWRWADAWTGVTREPYIARVSIGGVIIDDAARDRALARLAERGEMRALIVHINSPGGTLAGSETLYRRLREIARTRPVVAVMGELAASGGYMTALGADHIVAREGTLTGSIGVIIQGVDVTDLLRTLGVRIHNIKSDPLKAVPSPVEPLSPEGRAAVQAVVDDAYQMFLDMVIERRSLTRERARELADGRIYTGRQARQSGLVDTLGGEAQARTWLAGRGVAETVPMRDIDFEPRSLWRRLMAGAVDAVTGKSYFLERLTLDGLLVVWQPQLVEP